MTDVLKDFETASRVQVHGWVEKTALTMIKQGEREAAQSLLTFYSHTRAAEALEIGHTLNNALDGYIKLTGRWRGPVGKEINDSGEGNETVNCLVGYDPDKPKDLQPNPR